MTLPPLFHTVQNLGAVQLDPRKPRIQFRLYFPSGFNTQISQIRVAYRLPGAANFDFTICPLLTKVTAPEGDFWTLEYAKDLSTGFYEYKYQATFTNGTKREVADPCARYSGQANESSGFVIGGSTAASNTVVPLQVRKPLRDLVVYELHALDFTDEYRSARAPLDAIRDKLDYLVDLGVNAILIEPWTAWKDKEYDWGYSIFQYFSVEYAYANDLNTPEEKISWLKKLISDCHQRKIHVVMDGVYNHCDMAFPYKKFYLDMEKCPYTAEAFGGTFPGLQDLDFNNSCTQDFIRDVCLYWIKEFKIDGIRFDNTVNYYVAGSTHGIPELLASIKTYVEGQGQKNFSMTLEHLNEDAANLVNNSAATSYWDNGLYQECFNHLGTGNLSPNYLAVLNNSQYVKYPDKVATLYLSNHDHSAVAWQAGVRNMDGAAEWYRTQPHIIALLTASGTPLIHSGSEFAEDYWVPEDDHGTSRRVRPRPLHWKEVQDGFGSKMWSVYQKLLKIRQAHTALRSNNFHPPKWEGWMTRLDGDGFGVDTARSIIVFHRWDDTELIYVALNFGDEPQNVTLQFAQDGEYTDLLTGKMAMVAGKRLMVTLESHWGVVFCK